MRLIKLTLPTYWASPLINDDETGLDDAEVRALDAFMRDMLDQYGKCFCVGVEDDEEFVVWHDARPYGVLACDCATFLFEA